MTCLQIRRAWERRYHRQIPADKTFTELFQQLRKDMGFHAAEMAVLRESNDPDAPEPPIEENS